MEQRYRTPVPHMNFASLFKHWLAIQNGVMTMEELEYESIPRYLSTPRGLVGYVHADYTFQAFLCAALTLSRLGTEALSDTNPYKRSRTQTGFATFGEAHIIDCMSRATNASLKAAWFQKWLVHRRIRPEEFAFRVHETLLGEAGYAVSRDLARSAVVARVHSATGGLLLPQGYPEGCPVHPSYPAGHAVIAGACCTMLKAFFDERFEMPDAVMSNDDGTTLVPYEERPLTVGGELNKLASNIAMARDAAGVHWRSDSAQGIRLGETVALGLLRDIAETAAEPFKGFRLTTFDGRKATLGISQGEGSKT